MLTFPVSDGPAPKFEVCQKFPLTKSSLPKLYPPEIPPLPCSTTAKVIHDEPKRERVSLRRED